MQGMGEDEVLLNGSGLPEGQGARRVPRSRHQRGLTVLGRNIRSQA